MHGAESQFPSQWTWREAELQLLSPYCWMWSWGLRKVVSWLSVLITITNGGKKLKQTHDKVKKIRGTEQWDLPQVSLSFLMRHKRAFESRCFFSCLFCYIRNLDCHCFPRKAQLMEDFQKHRSTALPATLSNLLPLAINGHSLHLAALMRKQCQRAMFSKVTSNFHLLACNILKGGEVSESNEYARYGRSQVF